MSIGVSGQLRNFSEFIRPDNLRKATAWRTASLGLNLFEGSEADCKNTPFEE
jgi:hypothetical protein